MLVSKYPFHASDLSPNPCSELSERGLALQWNLPFPRSVANLGESFTFCIITRGYDLQG